MTYADTLEAALIAGFAISTAYGQESNRLMPISDSKTLMHFAELVAQAELKEIIEFAKLLPPSLHQQIILKKLQERLTQ